MKKLQGLAPAIDTPVNNARRDNKQISESLWKGGVHSKTDGKQPKLEDPNSPSNSLATKPLEKISKALDQAEHDQSVWVEVKQTSQDNPSTVNLEANIQPKWAYNTTPSLGHMGKAYVTLYTLIVLRI